MAGPRAVLFDADQVLQRPAGSLEEKLERILGRVPDDVDAFIRHVLEAERPCQIGESDFVVTLKPVMEDWRARVDSQASIR